MAPPAGPRQTRARIVHGDQHAIATNGFDALKKLYVQYGGGFCAPAGWYNYDASPTLRFERLPLIGRLLTKNADRFPVNCRYGDIVRGLKLAPASVHAIYASHVLEHLALRDCQIALANTFSLLEPGGVFRLVMPDLQWRAAAYLAAVQAGAPDANTALLRSCYLGREAAPRGMWHNIIELFGHSRHLWMWDEPSITHALAQAGFTAIRRARRGDNLDPLFAVVEEERRFTSHGHEELAMQATRPR